MTESTEETTANSTWSRMLAGNRRFAEGKAEHPWQDKETRESLIDTQNPDAAARIRACHRRSFSTRDLAICSPCAPPAR